MLRNTNLKRKGKKRSDRCGNKKLKKSFTECIDTLKDEAMCVFVQKVEYESYLYISFKKKGVWVGGGGG